MARRYQFLGNFQTTFVPYFFVQAPHNAFVIGGHSALLFVLCLQPPWRRLRPHGILASMWGRSEAGPSLLPRLVLCNPPTPRNEMLIRSTIRLGRRPRLRL